MKVLGNVQLGSYAYRLAEARLGFPPVGATPNKTACGLEYAVGERREVSLPVAPGLELVLALEAGRTAEGEEVVVVTTYPASSAARPTRAGSARGAGLPEEGRVSLEVSQGKEPRLRGAT